MKGFGAQKIWSHESLDHGDRFTNKDTRRSQPYRVQSFEELVKNVAKISVQNAELALFFRGQNRDFRLNSGASSSYPPIFRKAGERLPDDELLGRFEKLDDATNRLLTLLKKEKIDGHDKAGKFPEILWAILQHYEVCSTPLLDVSHSLRVAASFALNGSGDGVLLVYGFPYPSGSITYSVEQELVNVRLLSICPPEATRPHFQEGFLVGTFPTRAARKHPSHDVCTRLLAKFRLEGESFWSEHFQPIPNPALFPSTDIIKDLCSAIDVS